MFEPIFQRTQTERADDVNRSLRPMSYNCPSHDDRMDAHCKRVQRDYFDSGLFYEEIHKAQGGSING